MHVYGRTDVAIVGGGVIGLLSAFMLASEGVSVVVFDRQQLGGEASWAGGGIVSPLYPWRYKSAVTALAHWSQDFYPMFGERLARECGVDPEVQTTGLYWLDLEDEAEALAWAAREGRQLESMAAIQVAERVKELGGSFERGLWLSGVANIRNPRLLKALRVTLEKMGNVTLVADTAVQGIAHSQGRVSGVQMLSGRWDARQVLISAGAWSGQLLAGLGLSLPVEPVKGQMILYKCAEDFLPAIVLAGGRYAIPRKDGHVLVGSTLEHVGFDKVPTDEALISLKASAEQLLPALAEAEVVGHWAGLRPGSPEGIPFIGEVPEFPGLWLNCGHYRNGLVLAPASCRLLADLMLGREPIVDPAPYLPLGRLG